MRYNDWDILLFPGISTVPIQEFKTDCYAVLDTEQLDSLEGHSLNEPKQSTPSTAHVIPLVACFVPSQPAGSPFRVSIHNWEPKSFSERLRSSTKPGKHACYEIRVIIDGICVS
jgi:hypothetical protein